MFFSSCSKLSEYDRQQINRAMSDSLTSKTESWNFSLTLSQQGKRSFRAWAAYATTFESDSGSVTRASGPVRILVYDSTGIGIKQEIRCGNLVYFARTAFLEMHDNVSVITSDNRKLRTQHLVWFEDRNSLATSGFVTLITPNDSIAGYGLQAKDDLSEYRIKEVSGEVTVDRADQ